MGFWDVRTADPFSPMRWRAYTEYKLLEIDPAWPAFAWQVVAWLSHRPYEVFYHNCMNATYDVLRAFGARDLPAPAHHWEPNHWFDHVRGPAFALEANGATALARQIARPVAALGLGVAGGWSSGVSARITPAPPGWRIPDTPEWHELQRAIAAAPPMPGRQPGRAKCARAMITRLRRLFGT